MATTSNDKNLKLNKTKTENVRKAALKMRLKVALKSSCATDTRFVKTAAAVSNNGSGDTMLSARALFLSEVQSAVPTERRRLRYFLD